VAESSWDKLDLDGKEIQKAREENEAKSHEIAGQFQECFSTDAGQYVLDRLKSITIDKPVLNPNSTQFGAGIREGQNNIVRQIIDQLSLADKK
jgi:hypothetical protein|tara:strand:- start:58 stop:336 length:279 start_codon:yes stop_codon:yes gene_type:complete